METGWHNNASAGWLGSCISTYPIQLLECYFLSDSVLSYEMKSMLLNNFYPSLLRSGPLHSTMSSPLAATSSSAAAAAAEAVAPSLLNNVQAVGSAWMISSAIFTTYSTTKFLKFQPPITTSRKGKVSKSQNSSQATLPRATLLTLYRFAGSLLLGLLAHPNFHIIDRLRQTIDLIPAFTLPAVFLFIANFSNSISLNRIGISLTYTSKCAIPLITLLITVLWDGVEALPGTPALLTLIPIALGIAGASWNHPTFETVGFLAAFVSCTAQSALNVTCKHTMKRLAIAGPVAQRSMVAVGMAITAILSILHISAPSKELDEKDTSSPTSNPPAWLTAAAVTAYHVEYVLSFIFVNLVAPITYSTCDAVRRLSIIISGHYMFGGAPFTTVNILGIAMALCGALGYSMLH